MKKSIRFAYFGDNNFIGWYGDSFGSIVKTSPKIYGYSKEQIATIQGNLTYKMSKLKEESNIGSSNPAFAIIDNSLNRDKTNLLNYNEVELRIVECPEYDGRNPDFDEVAYEQLIAERKEQMTKEGIFDIPAPSRERTNAIAEFEIRYPRQKCDNWIYADYEKVKAWASIEPTVFIEILKP